MSKDRTKIQHIKNEVKYWNRCQFISICIVFAVLFLMFWPGFSWLAAYHTYLQFVPVSIAVIGSIWVSEKRQQALIRYGVSVGMTKDRAQMWSYTNFDNGGDGGDGGGD